MLKTRHAGFTLIETLCVISILSILLLTMGFLPFKTLREDYEVKVFKDRLTSQLYLAQDCAIIEQKPIHVQFSKSGNITFKDTETHKLLALIELPSNLNLLSSFSFYYLSDGRINQFESVYFEEADGDVFKLVFQLGSGQFEFKS